MQTVLHAASMSAVHIPVYVEWSVSMLGVLWNPSNFLELVAILHEFRGNMQCFLWIFFAAQCWALWLIRNKYTIESKLPRHVDCVFKTRILLQHWRTC
jgi:hypothetical protein